METLTELMKRGYEFRGHGYTDRKTGKFLFYVEMYKDNKNISIGWGETPEKAFFACYRFFLEVTNE